MTPRGIETGIRALSWQYPDRAGLPGAGAGPLGEPGIGAVTRSLGARCEDPLPAVSGGIIVGHLKPLETGLALAEVLDLLVNEQDPNLTGCPKKPGTP